MKCHVAVDSSFRALSGWSCWQPLLLFRTNESMLHDFYRDFSFSAFGRRLLLKFNYIQIFPLSHSDPSPFYAFFARIFPSSSLNAEHCCFTIYLYLRHHRTSNIVFTWFAVVSCAFFLCPFLRAYKNRDERTIHRFILYFHYFALTLALALSLWQMPRAPILRE